MLILEVICLVLFTMVVATQFVPQVAVHISLAARVHNIYIYIYYVLLLAGMHNLYGKLFHTKIWPFIAHTYGST